MPQDRSASSRSRSRHDRGNPEECSDLGIARDALIDEAIRDAIDLCGRWGLLGGLGPWSNPKRRDMGTA